MGLFPLSIWMRLSIRNHCRDVWMDLFMTTPAITPSGQLSAAATLEEKLALPMFLATLAFVILVSVTLRFLEKGELILESWPPFMLMYIPLWSLFILESAFFFWFYWKHFIYFPV